MSGWDIAHEQWAAWVAHDGEVAVPAQGDPTDELDARLLESLTRFPFPSSEDETISRPSLEETGSFDSRTTMVKGDFGGTDASQDFDEDDETRVRRDLPSNHLEVALEYPNGNVEVAPEPPEAQMATVITEPPAQPPDETPDETPNHTVIAPSPPADALPPAISGETIVIDSSQMPDPGPPPGPDDDGLYIPALTRPVVNESPAPPADEELPAGEPLPAISGDTVIGPPPGSHEGSSSGVMDESSATVPAHASSGTTAAMVERPSHGAAAGFIGHDMDEAAQTLVRGEIPSTDDDDPRSDDEPLVPVSKVVIDPSASGVLSAVYDEEEDDEEPTVVEEEPHELDAADLVEEADETEPAQDQAPPPPVPPVAPPAPPAVDVGPPPPPVSAASLHSAISSIPAAPAADEGWQVDAFAEHYAALLPVQRGASAATDAEFVMRCTGLVPGATVLDVGCGDGAHAVAFALRGLHVTGLDASPVQLMRASQAAQAAGVGVNLVSGDMRQPALDGSFDAVVCLGGTLGQFGDADDRQALQQMRDRLAPGGRLVIQVLNRDYITGRLPARSWWQGQGCLVLDEAQMYAPTSTVHVHRTVVFETGSQFEHNMALRVYGLTDLVHMCAHVGLTVVEYSGSRHTRGRFYGATSSEIWLLAQRIDG